MGKTWAQILAEQRDSALAKLVADERVPFSLQNAVKLEIEARKHADAKEWERMSLDERRAWLTDWVTEYPAYSARLKAEPKVAAAAGREERDAAAANPQLEVCRYRSKREYERDAAKRLANGWQLVGQSHDSAAVGRRAGKAVRGALLGSLVMMPRLGAAIGAASRTDTFTVTWMRQPLANISGDLALQSSVTPSAEEGA